MENRLAGDEDAKMTQEKLLRRFEVNRNDGERDEISVVYPVTTISKVVCVADRQIRERLVHDGTLPWSNHCSGAPAVHAGAALLVNPKRISSASSSDLAPQQELLPARWQQRRFESTFMVLETTVHLRLYLWLETKPPMFQEPGLDTNYYFYPLKLQQICCKLLT